MRAESINTGGLPGHAGCDVEQQIGASVDGRWPWGVRLLAPSASLSPVQTSKSVLHRDLGTSPVQLREQDPAAHQPSQTASRTGADASLRSAPSPLPCLQNQASRQS